MSALASLLSECESRGIRLLQTGVDGFTVDAPKGALTPDLLELLKRNKAAILARLNADATAVWQAAIDNLRGDPDFSEEDIQALRTADVRWKEDGEPST